jgi:hypothetical protein
VLHSSNGHDDDTMLVTTMPVYKELDTVPPSFPSDRAHYESWLFVHTAAKKIEKEG